MTKAELEQHHELWRARVADFRASGLSGAAWCAAHQVVELWSAFCMQMVDTQTGSVVDIWYNFEGSSCHDR